MVQSNSRAVAVSVNHLSQTYPVPFVRLKKLLRTSIGNISRILPPTSGLDGIRRVLIEGQGFAEVKEPFFMLMIFLGILLPFSLWVFNRAVKRAKREGSLIQY